ncbi:hypothetical protein VaNZ11_000985 [Volvox africanus]|uniref:Guanine nucleotide-binding protein subunit beta-like protein n=1 Tax=Volvox africanus TaxID=51714 RepID=A0ABQ5RNY3_9CHLO|nr:hypothetical protein VaNZ11_000985 [Volvox africanus]
MHASKDRNFSIVFRPQDASKHCAGVEALLIPTIPNHKVLFTASRDSTVKRWNVSGPAPALEASFEGHADWVNDLALIGDLLITCSNDQTVRLWRAGSENGHLLHTLAAHSDYVTRLAAAPDCRLVVSAGLRGEVFSYDVEGGLHTRFQLRGCSSDAEEAGQIREEACSVYALALGPSARLLAAGTSESLVRLLDPRSGRSICKLKGHKDVVRTLAVNSCGTKLLSGASDGAIKLWDVGMRRCIQTFEVHTDSVWSLVSPSDSLAYVYSAGRDRAIYRTNTQTCCAELLALEDAPIRALAVDQDARPGPSGDFGSSRVGLWAATSASHVNMWLVPPPGRNLHTVISVPSPRVVTSSGATVAGTPDINDIITPNGDAAVISYVTPNGHIAAVSGAVTPNGQTTALNYCVTPNGHIAAVSGAVTPNDSTTDVLSDCIVLNRADAVMGCVAPKDAAIAIGCAAVANCCIVAPVACSTTAPGAAAAIAVAAADVPNPRAHEAVCAAAMVTVATAGSHPTGPRPPDVPLLCSGRSFPEVRVSPVVSVDRFEPLVRKPVASIPGIPAIVAHEVLADRRRVLTKDARGMVALWDVLLGTEIVLYGKADFHAKRRELWEPRHVAPWFTCDHRLGCLCITLTPNMAFAVEDYAVNVGFGGVPEDRKVNYGKLVLECVLAKWRFLVVQSIVQNCCISPGGSSGSSSDIVYGMRLQQSCSGSGCCNGGCGAGACVGGADHRWGRPNNCCYGGGCRGCDEDDERPYYKELWPKYWQLATLPAVICCGSDGQRWRRLLTSFNGSEIEPDKVPTWVADVVLRSANVASLVSQVTFYLLPVKGSNLPTLSITRLQAPHILEVHKVAKYCCEKLQEHGAHLEVLPGHRQRVPLPALRASPRTAGAQQYMPYQVLELTCNGLAVPYDMTLAAVRKFLLRENDDLTFHYGVRDFSHPAPQPRLEPLG